MNHHTGLTQVVEAVAGAQYDEFAPHKRHPGFSVNLILPDWLLGGKAYLLLGIYSST
jgi:hypothetical protein